MTPCAGVLFPKQQNCAPTVGYLSGNKYKIPGPDKIGLSRDYSCAYLLSTLGDGFVDIASAQPSLSDGVIQSEAIQIPNQNMSSGDFGT
jgi:hypothetical protein